MFGQVSLPGQFVTTLNLPTLVGADISSAFALEHLVRILTVFYVLAVDVVATLEIVASESSALRDPTGKPLHYDRAVILSGIATIAGPLLGFFPCLPFFESLAGVKSGGKTWRVSIVAAVVFVLAAFLSPIAATVPGAASAVALAFIGYSITKIAWTLFPAENEKGNYSRIIRYCQTFGILGAAYVGSISFAVLLTVAAYPLALLKSGSRPSRSDWAVAVTCFGLLLLSLN
jgi:AGZA family xanthine/uracil permease-like MFS transporter